MRFLDLYISGFGKFHNTSVSFEDGINIVYGKNEAGKSTIHTFIRGMLFGIERQRGRAARTDTYSKYEPWENSGTYEGQLRLESDGIVYRIERSFQKNKKEFIIVNETLGKEVEPTKAFMDELLGGLSETVYNNTISISQLKSATEDGMISELKNYIANMNTSGNMALNITKATNYLKGQKKQFETQLSPEAARTYTMLLSEIRNIEKEISSPEYENQMQEYVKMRDSVKEEIELNQQEKDELADKVLRGRQMLDDYEFSDEASISAYLNNAEEIYSAIMTRNPLRRAAEDGWFPSYCFCWPPQPRQAPDTSSTGIYIRIIRCFLFCRLSSNLIPRVWPWPSARLCCWPADSLLCSAKAPSQRGKTLYRHPLGDIQTPFGRQFNQR